MKKIFFVIFFFLIVLFACPTSKSSSDKTADSETDTTETVLEEEPKEAKKEEKKEEPKVEKNERPQYTEYVVSTNGGRLNVRKEPNKSADIITKLENGKTVKVISSENGWAKVSTDFGEGYVSLDYLAQKNSDQMSSAEVASEPVNDEPKGDTAATVERTDENSMDESSNSSTTGTVYYYVPFTGENRSRYFKVDVLYPDDDWWCVVYGKEFTTDECLKQELFGVLHWGLSFIPLEDIDVMLDSLLSVEAGKSKTVLWKGWRGLYYISFTRDYTHDGKEYPFFMDFARDNNGWYFGLMQDEDLHYEVYGDPN